jgi:dTDP-4-dehydrorhamnose reductase
VTTVFVVGHRGMLGQVVRRFLRDVGHEIVTSDCRFTGGDRDPLIEEIVRSDVEVVVNCAGAIPSRVTSPDEMFRSNAWLPTQISSRLRPGQTMIQASTDGVFDGRHGPYAIVDPPDAIDTYGFSKRLGELARLFAPVIVVRTSIVGTSGGLLGWLLQQRVDVDGYVNHLWNGVTTLEWAHVSAELIDRLEPRVSEIVHVASAETVSKHELLTIAASVFETDIEVRPVAAPASINRALIANTPRSPIRAQLAELRRWEAQRT